MSSRAEASVAAAVGFEEFAVGPDEGDAGAPTVAFVAGVLADLGGDGFGVGGERALGPCVDVGGGEDDEAALDEAGGGGQAHGGGGRPVRFRVSNHEWTSGWCARNQSGSVCEIANASVKKSVSGLLSA